MVIIYGRRSFGRIDAHGGEFAHTSFVHAYYMPIVPISTYWITEDDRAYEIRPSGKSIAAAYLRSWGPIAAVIALSATHGLAHLAALPFVALTAWAWSWRTLRGRSAQRRSDFQLLAYRMRCDPKRMLPPLKQTLKASLEERWQKLDPGRPPDDVARFGPRSRDEAVLAYGLLGLAGDPAAARILEGAHDALPVGDSPYRGGETEAPVGVLDEVAAAARHTPRARGPWWRYTRGKAAIAVFIGMAAIGGVIEEGPSLTAPRYGVAELSELPNRQRYIEVRCDEVERLAPFANGTPATACRIDGRTLLVAGEMTGTTVIGQLRMPDEITRFGWFRSMPTDSLAVFLEVKSPSKAAAIGCIATLAALLGIAVVWLNAKLRRSA